MTTTIEIKQVKCIIISSNEFHIRILKSGYKNKYNVIYEDYSEVEHQLLSKITLLEKYSITEEQLKELD